MRGGGQNKSFRATHLYRQKIQYKIKAHVLKKMVSNLQLAIKVFQSYLKLE